MTDWAALGATDDPRERARVLSSVHDLMATGGLPDGDGLPPTALRPVVERSWRRSLARGLDPSLPITPSGRLADDELARRREHHPLAVAPALMQRALTTVDDPDHLAFVADADGRMLWLDGRPHTIDRVNEAGVVEGGAYAETDLGTTGVGAALAEGRALQIFGAEHFGVLLHPLACSAAPVRDPLSGEIVGVIGLSGSFRATHPHSLTLVSLAARAIEHELLTDAQAGAARILHMPEAALTVLGRERGIVRIGHRHIELSRRHTEILLLLWLVPDGLTAEQLAVELYGRGGRPGTVRTEMHRLRAGLERLVGERPYRLLGRIDCDVAEIDGLISAGDLAAAMLRYPGSALATTTAPRLVELREAIDERVRGAVLQSGDADLLERWLRTPGGRDDAEASRRLVAGLGRSDPRRAAERSRLRRLMVPPHDT